MTKHQKRARELFENGCHCAQATLVALCDEIHMCEEDALAISSCFGGGIGRMRQTCGALSGMLMALGLALGRYDIKQSSSKDAHYRLTQYAAARFRQKVGSVFCYELLNIPAAAELPVSAPRNAQFYQTRPCVQVVLAAVEVFDEVMAEYKNGTLEGHLTPEQAQATTDFLNQK